jgi:hypothetical protein
MTRRAIINSRFPGFERNQPAIPAARSGQSRTGMDESLLGQDLARAASKHPFRRQDAHSILAANEQELFHVIVASG